MELEIVYLVQADDLNNGGYITHKWEQDKNTAIEAAKLFVPQSVGPVRVLEQTSIEIWNSQENC